LSEFWSVAAFLGLAVLAVAGALACLLPFLWRDPGAARARAMRRDMNLAVYRDQLRDLKAEFSAGQITEAQYQAARLELETRAAEDAVAAEEAAGTPAPRPAPASSRWLGIGLAATLPVAAFGMYFWLGNPAVMTAIAAAQGASTASAGPTREDVVAMTGRIETRTQTHPDDGMAWEALGVAYGLAGRWPESVQAFERAHALQPGKPSVLVGYAEALALANDQALTGRSIELVEQALQIDPGNRKGLQLAFIHAYQSGAYEQAVAYIDRLLGQGVPLDSPAGRELLAMRSDAASRMQAQAAGGPDAARAPGVAPSPRAPGAAAPASPPPAVAAVVTGTVDVADALRARVGPQDVVFVLARAATGGPPLAALRVPVGSLPMRFRLDDSLAMLPGNVLSMHEQVTLVARISPSGNPIAQPGDLEGQIAGVVVGGAAVTLVIDRVLP
jgi:cytochrome c-type biogenesis protein CcmH